MPPYGRRREQETLDRIVHQIAALEARVGKSESSIEQRLRTVVHASTERSGALEATVTAERAAAAKQHDLIANVLGELRDRLAAVERQIAGNRLPALADATARSTALATPTLGDIGLSPGQRVRHPYAAACSRVICSLAVGSYLDLLPISGTSFLDYARRWGWDVVLSAEDLADGRMAPWGKVRLIRELLDEYELVLWLDADAVFVNTQADVTQVITNAKDLYLVEHRWGEPVNSMPNAGVMLVRSSPWSRSFLERMWACEHFATHPWSDNAALVELIGYQLEPVRLTNPNEDLDKVQFIPLAWNSVSVAESVNPYVKHYAGQGKPVDDLRECLLDDLARLRLSGRRRAIRDTSGRASNSLQTLRRLSELPRLLMDLGLQGCGVEVGLHDGERAEQLLAGWSGQTLISVDVPSLDEAGVSPDDADRYAMPVQWPRARLAKFRTRSEVWSMTSREAAVRLPNGTLDFVYLDARGAAPSIQEEMALWWEKVRPGGILSGSHYIDVELHAGAFGARAAVDAFCEARGLNPSMTTEDEQPTWFVVRELA